MQKVGLSIAGMLSNKSGNAIDDIDFLIAGIAIENDMILVTRNTNHFGRINRLEVQDWSK